VPQVIVRSLESGRRYLLLGTGFGEWQSARPSALLGNLAPVTDHGDSRMVCVCDRSGTLGWLKSEQVVVETVDGRPIGELEIDEAPEDEG
jgi:hypothetical protein